MNDEVTDCLTDWLNYVTNWTARVTYVTELVIVAVPDKWQIKVK